MNKTVQYFWESLASMFYHTSAVFSATKIQGNIIIPKKRICNRLQMHARYEDTIMILNTCENFLYTVDQDQFIKRKKATFALQHD